MPDYLKPDVEALAVDLSKTPLEPSTSDKGRFFNHEWWPNHYKLIERPVLEAIARMEDSSFARRVNILQTAQKVDAGDGNKLQKMGFTVDEITRYVTRAMNKRLRSLARGQGHDSCYVIRNQKLVPLALENKTA